MCLLKAILFIIKEQEGKTEVNNKEEDKPTAVVVKLYLQKRILGTNVRPRNVD